ncbi:hypothetical protein BC628DRAFT_1418734 [Trametes gibbosa]|nr:hypothetical protein BC628DRAFT_1418734 [Trametes gibbosa]
MQPLVRASDTLGSSAHSETTPPLTRRKAELGDVKPLGFLELWPAMNGTGRAFVNDSLARYFDSSDTWPLAKFRVWLVKLLTYGGSIYQRRMLTIGGGASCLIFATPKVNKPHWLVGLLIPVINFFRPAELVRRRDEFAAGVQAQVQDAFGTKVSEMYEIQGLATDPAAQGRGYGGLLVKTVTNMGDAEGRDVWVITSDARPFYERHGFGVMRTVLIGGNNPLWKNEPVNISIMHRPAKLLESSKLKAGTALQYT